VSDIRSHAQGVWY